MKILQKLILLLALSALPLGAFAQGQSGAGGGHFTEANLKDFMGELAKYFADPESLKVFPEVDKYNKNHELQFLDLLKQIEPKVVDHAVFVFGEERDCVSYVDHGQRWFECNSAKIPENTLQNQPVLYIILLHEVMVQAGIEVPDSNVPSHYQVSSRIGNTENLSLVTYQKWVPKAQQVKEKPHFSETTYLQCHVPDLNIQMETRILQGFGKADFTLYEGFKKVRPWEDKDGEDRNFKVSAGEGLLMYTNISGYNYESAFENRYGYNVTFTERRATRDSLKYDYNFYKDQSRYLEVNLDFKKSFVSTDGNQLWVKGEFKITSPQFNYNERTQKSLRENIKTYAIYCTAPMYRGIRMRANSQVDFGDGKKYYNRIPDGAFEHWSVDLMKQYQKNTRKMNEQ